MTNDTLPTHRNNTTNDTLPTGKFLNICNIYNIYIYKNKKYKESNYSYILYLSVIYLLKDYRQIYKNNKYYTDRFRQKGGTR